ncbi:MAG: adenosylmethionine--8-amino-7-oxononanoate transaminase [Raineya sp.]|nr:adenosylmethionine--8-amino-7-oxononanoate transaminase [Raineya sp.]
MTEKKILSETLRKDQHLIWHPFTPLVGAEMPLSIVKAEGIYLYTEDGRKILDGIASWWVNLHGHSHPHIANAIFEQAQKLEHVIFAGFTHEPAVKLAERLLAILPANQSKVFFSDDGSTACEVAIKMALQYWYNLGETQKTEIIALQGAYHGDTFGGMSVAERNLFNRPFVEKLFDVHFLPFPACYRVACCAGKRNNPSCISAKATIQTMHKLAETGKIAAFIYEPLIQGAAGMRMYSSEILDELLSIAQKYEILCIADEVMTGFGRTGKLFASEYCSQKPDIMCLSKGITGGTMPLGVTTCTEKIISAFRSAEKTKTFYHGHSYTANPLACAAANANLDLLLQQETLQKIFQITQMHANFEAHIRFQKAVAEARSLGTILAIELKSEQATSYFNDMSKEIYRYFLQRNLLLRPLGNVLYVMPPYCIESSELEWIYQEIEQFLQQKI